MRRPDCAARGARAERRLPLIGRPEVFRQICRIDGCRPAKNMPEGYLNGEIARPLGEKAAGCGELTVQCPARD